MIKLDVTVRRAEELHEQELEIQRLNDVLQSKEREIHEMGKYAALYLQALDQLKAAKQLLDQAGLDSSVIQIR